MYILGKMSQAGRYLYPAATVICLQRPYQALEITEIKQTILYST